MPNTTQTAQSEMSAYLKAVYNFGYKGGGIFIADSNFTQRHYCRSLRSLESAAAKCIRDSGTAYVSLNIYRRRRGQPVQRGDGHLWRLNHVVIDIDYTAENHTALQLVEAELQERVVWHCASNGIPVPSHIVFTGSGGCHLYYVFEDLPCGWDGGMAAGVQAVKMKLAAKWVEAEAGLHAGGAFMRVDTKACDTSRMLRVPGSTHEKTGRMCRIVTLRPARYQYKALCGMLDEKKWNGEYAIRNAYRDIERIRFGCRGSGKHLFKPLAEGNMTAGCLAVKRINELFSLAHTGWGFHECRERAAHLLWVWARDAHLTEDETHQRLFELNGLFHTPLTERELLYTARGSRRPYWYSNARIREYLCLDGSEGFFTGRRVRRNKGRAEKTRRQKHLIARLVCAGKTIREISIELGWSVSIVKRRRAEMNRQEGFAHWAAMPG